MYAVPASIGANVLTIGKNLLPTTEAPPYFWQNIFFYDVVLLQRNKFSFSNNYPEAYPITLPNTTIKVSNKSNIKILTSKWWAAQNIPAENNCVSLGKKNPKNNAVSLIIISSIIVKHRYAISFSASIKKQTKKVRDVLLVYFKSIVFVFDGFITKEATMLVIKMPKTLNRATSIGILYTSASTIFNPINIRMAASP